MEHCLESRFRKEVSNVDSCCKELGVIDHFVAMVVHLRNDVVDLGGKSREPLEDLGNLLVRQLLELLENILD